MTKMVTFFHVFLNLIGLLCHSSLCKPNCLVQYLIAVYNRYSIVHRQQLMEGNRPSCRNSLPVMEWAFLYLVILPMQNCITSEL